MTGVPGWLLKIVAGFLESRTLILSYKGDKSSSKEIPGGGPQGTILGMFLFIVLINAAGFSAQQNQLGQKITKATNRRVELPAKHWKYVDDLTAAEAINLKNKLIEDPEKSWEEPVKFHSRTKQTLPPHESKVQDELNRLHE